MLCLRMDVGGEHLALAAMHTVEIDRRVEPKVGME